MEPLISNHPYELSRNTKRDSPANHKSACTIPANQKFEVH